VARRDAQGSLERRERVGVAVEHPQRHSAGEVRVHVPRIDRQDAVEAGDRLLRPAEPGEDESALEQRLRMLRSERRDAVEGRKRLRRAVEIVQAKPEIEERVRRRRVDLQGRRDEARALLVVRLLAFEDAEMMQCLEMLRRVREGYRDRAARPPRACPADAERARAADSFPLVFSRFALEACC
jgi:hypothetical protein